MAHNVTLNWVAPSPSLMSCVAVLILASRAPVRGGSSLKSFVVPYGKGPQSTRLSVHVAGRGRRQGRGEHV